MNDSFITALNVQKATATWVDVITDNLSNAYTPGFKETQVSFYKYLPMYIFQYTAHILCVKS